MVDALDFKVDFSKYLIYDETSPSGLRWKSDHFSGVGYNVRHICAGDIAGSKTKKGYWSINLHSKSYQCHRVIMLLLGHEVSGYDEVDHIDHDKSNNKIENLRVVKRAINLRNKGVYSCNTTGATGVCLNKKHWSGGTLDYWVARWYDLGGVLRGKHFRIDKLGYDEAFQLACDYRSKMIAELNEQGAGYTENHGK